MPLTLAQMEALFADNTAGDISAADGRDVIGALYEWAVPDKGARSLLTRPAAVNAEDDHFDAATLDGKWSTGYSGTHSANTTDLDGWLHLITGTAVLQAVPAGDWTIEAEVITTGSTAASYTNTGLMLTTGTAVGSSNDARFGIGQNNLVDGYRYVFERFNAGVFSSALATWALASYIHHSFLRVEKVGTTYTTFISGTGKTWNRLFQTSSLGITPTHFGLYVEGGTGDAFFNYFLRF